MKFYSVKKDFSVIWLKQSYNTFEHHRFSGTGSTNDHIDLSLLKLTKDLSFGERKLYDTAHNLLIKELSMANECDEKAVIAEIDALFTPEDSDA